jgi:hypothetical protein
MRHIYATKSSSNDDDIIFPHILEPHLVVFCFKAIEMIDEPGDKYRWTEYDALLLLQYL